MLFDSDNNHEKFDVYDTVFLYGVSVKFFYVNEHGMKWQSHDTHTAPYDDILWYFRCAFSFFRRAQKPNPTATMMKAMKRRRSSTKLVSAMAGTGPSAGTMLLVLSMKPSDQPRSTLLFTEASGWKWWMIMEILNKEKCWTEIMKFTKLFKRVKQIKLKENQNTFTG